MRGASIKTTVHLLSMQRLEDCLNDALGLGQHIGIPKPQNAIAIRPNERVTAFIIVRLLSVLTAVEFDDDGGFEADEIANIGTERSLSAELEAAEASAAQYVP